MDDTIEQTRQAAVILQRLREHYLGTLFHILEHTRRTSEPSKTQKIQFLIDLIQKQ